MELNHTHDGQARSWLASANLAGTDFPIQNLPFGVFRRAGSSEAFRGGVAIGDQILDLAALGQTTALQGLALDAARACSGSVLNDFFALGSTAWRALRHALFDLLRADSPAAPTLQACLLPQSAAEMGLPSRIANYTDFYTSIHHARNVGRLARPDDPLTDNFQWLPIAYHGRASSVGVSGQKFHRPMGQSRAPGAAAPVYGPCARMDFELELGLFVGPGNALGEPIALAQAEQHAFGVCLLNDWSARDIQFWEMAPLGPFLGKNFATTISPWIVTLEALAPYRLPWQREAAEPQPLAYLDDPQVRAEGAFDIQLSVGIESAARRALGAGAATVAATSFRHQYWTFAQMLAQHTVGGCNLQAGDLLGSGTISGPTASECGAIIELTEGGRKPLTLRGGGAPDEQRAFLLDGDAVELRGWCEKPGFARIGLGCCRGELLPVRGAVAG